MHRTSEPPRPSSPQLHVDAALVAQCLQMDVAQFRTLMDRRQISVLCERGTGEDAGTYRATFYHGRQRARLLLDARGRVLSRECGSTKR